jgi:hypothetical protein
VHITWIYRLIVFLLSGFLVWEVVVEKRFTRQLTAVIVLVPMLLRLLMIK